MTQKGKWIGRDTFRLKGAPVTGVAVVILFTLGVILLPADGLGKLMTGDATAAPLLGGALLRLLGFAALMLLRLDLGYTPQRPRAREWLLILPFFVVAVNNLPILAIASGTAAVTQPVWVVLVYALWCLSVALIEETAFRGLVLPLLLRKLEGRKNAALWAVLISAGLFGAIHLVNLLSNPVLPVLAQVGYSFLIGCVCAVAVLRTRSPVTAVLFHFVYNLCGLLIPTVGAGALWDVPTVVLTVVVSLLAAPYVLWVLLRVPKTNVTELTSGKAALVRPEPAAKENDNAD